MNKETKQRIEKEAADYSLGQDNFDGESGYIAGATAEHITARNKAIDDAGQLFITFLPIGEVEPSQIVKASQKFLKELESLKSQPEAI